jgi:hypothetical protein
MQPALAPLWLVAALAYIDPGSGSFIFQAFIGGVLAVLVILRTSWSRIVGLFKRAPREQGQR